MSMHYFRYLTLPATLVHELLHVLPATLWADSIAIEWRPRSGLATAHVKWRPGAPDWAVILSGLAPFLAGLLTGALALTGWLSQGTPTPSTTIGWTGWTIVAMWWVVAVAPSRSDLKPATDSR
jgi:hypothetical protein